MKIILSNTDLNQVITNYINSLGLNTSDISVEFSDNEAVIELNPVKVLEDTKDTVETISEASEPLFG